jgi:hypothetical protein
MKFLPVVLLLFMGVFSIQTTIAQDSSNNAPPIQKKTTRHKHIKTDSTVRILNDSSINNEAKRSDSLITADTLTKKSTKHKLIKDDSAEFIGHFFYCTFRLVHVPRSSIRIKFLFPDSTFDSQFVVDPVAASYSDSVKIAVRDSIFIVDSLKAIATALADSINADSINRHWIGWRKYQVKPGESFNLFSKRVLKGKSKTDLQYNIADFYLYLNGELVKPPKTGFNFFAAGCLSFKYDDTLLLNSGLGFKVGVGVGIKIIQGRFTGSLHANTRNQEVYKLTKDDSLYLKSVTVEPITQTLKFQTAPAYSADEIIIGEYRATYKKFYQKNENDEDEARQYTVRIVFRCRVSGGIDSIKTLGGTSSK